jgi:hypothetical protein
MMVRAINADIVAEAAAVAAGGVWAAPGVPSFQEYLDIMSADVKGTPSWDYITDGSGRSAMDVKKFVPGAKFDGNCDRCGKAGHMKKSRIQDFGTFESSGRHGPARARFSNVSYSKSHKDYKYAQYTFLYIFIL